MDQKLYELLNTCVVRIVVPKLSQGTGFFVAPGTVLTCAHVVEAAQKGNVPIEVWWHGQMVVAQIQEFRSVSYPDLALLRVDLAQHLCVLLHGGAEPFSELYTYGYADIEAGGASSIFTAEGWAGEQQAMLKFNLGRVRPGMSGSPLFNRETGCVCGIVQFTHDRNTNLGGKALLAQVVLQEFPGLEAQQQQFHRQDRRWVDLLTEQQRQHAGLTISSSETVATGAIEVFVSYVRADEALRRELAKHLKPMKRKGLIVEWYADNVEAGVEQKKEAKAHLDAARIILLLVSPDFLDSDYHYDFEMTRALERHNAGTARVIPIMLRHTEGWGQTEFHKLQALPRDGRPVKQWGDRDDALAKIAAEIRVVAENLKNA